MTAVIPFHAIVLCAGTGQRFGAERPKQFLQLAGKTVLRHSLECFLATPGLQSLTAVISPQHEPVYRKSVYGLSLPPPIYGGETRKDSCFNALLSLPHLKDETPVLIHDAARPLIRQTDILNILTSLQSENSVSFGLPVSETLRRSDGQNYLSERIKRENVWRLQTPQGFRYGPLMAAHKKVKDMPGFTDDCSILEAFGYQTKILPGSSKNIKITWQDDLELCELFLKQDAITVVGHGFDVHAVSDRPSQFIRLGGIDVPFSHALSAHSDGDVVLHALTDALLGAIGGGDIGQHFPPSDPQWKNKDSAHFLSYALEHVHGLDCSINNVDLTILCEVPKIGPHQSAMRHRIATLMNLNETQVNIKATTTESLGFVGRGEGVAVQAIVSATRRSPCHAPAE